LTAHAGTDQSMLDLFEQAVGGASRPRAGWREDLTRRLRALLHADPLLSLKRNEIHLPDDLKHYDPLAVGIAVLDLVIENSGLYTDLEPEDVTRLLSEPLSAMDARAEVKPDGERHEAIVMRVLGALRNDSQHLRPFEYTYVIPSGDGGEAVARQLKLRIIEDRHHPDGRVVLSLTDGAANLFLNAIDLDIEDRQLANAAVIAMQMERGRFQEALRSAHEARLLSIQYKGKIEKAIEVTRRNLRRVDWIGDVRETLAAALDHITYEMQKESEILRMAEDRLETLEPGSDQARQVGRIVELIEDCTRRHRTLHYSLMRARKVFLAEQDRQAFARPAAVDLPNPEQDLLARIMAAEAGDAVRVIEASTGALVGPIVPQVFKLTEMVVWQMSPKRLVRVGEAPMKEREWEDQGEPEKRYPDALIDRAGTYLEALVAPTPLEEVVAAAEAADEEVRTIEALVLLAYRLYGIEDGAGADRFGIRALPSDAPPFRWGRLEGDALVLLPKE
jgi:hypothetical protein